jgi:hypothetical protein
MLFETPLHPASERLTEIKTDIPHKRRMFPKTGEIARIQTLQIKNS